MRIPIVGGAYQSPFKRANAQKCVNWYPHIFGKLEAESKPGYLKPTPGLTSVTSATGTRVKGIYSDNDLCFYVVGNVLYQFDGNISTTIGTMSNMNDSPNTRVYMRLNGNNQLGIFNVSASYVYDVDAETLTQITDADFPGVEYFEYIDGYGMVVYNGRVYFSNLNDFTSWTGADVFTPTYEADNTIAIMKLRGIVWCFGNRTIEPYYNDGSAPFSRTPQATIDAGLYAKDTIAKFSDGILFLGKSSRGSLSVYILSKQHDLAQVSPGSIDSEMLENREALASAYGFIEESEDSHIFYHLCIPDLGRTFTYDILTKEWHERSSIAPYKDGQGAEIVGHWRVNCMTEFKGKYLVGDWYTGNVFELDYDALTENGTRIDRERVLGPFSEEQRGIIVREFMLDYEYTDSNTTSPKIMFSASKDGGNNYFQERQINLPEQGVRGERLRIKNLGRGYHWTVKIKLSDEIKLAIIDASARLTAGGR